MNIILKLTKIANHLDRLHLRTEADRVDAIIFKLSALIDDFPPEIVNFLQPINNEEYDSIRKWVATRIRQTMKANFKARRGQAFEAGDQIPETWDITIDNPHYGIPDFFERLEKINYWAIKTQPANLFSLTIEQALEQAIAYAEKERQEAEEQKDVADTILNKVYDNLKVSDRIVVVPLQPKNISDRREQDEAILEACVAEGDALEHCAGGYDEDIVNGKTSLFSLRLGDANGTRIATIEIQDGKLEQLKGKWDEPPPSEYFVEIRRWIHKLGLQYSEEGAYDFYTLFGEEDVDRFIRDKNAKAISALLKVGSRFAQLRYQEIFDAFDDHPKVLSELAKRYNLPANILRELATSTNHAVLMGVAANEGAHIAEIAPFLLDREDIPKDVRWKIATNYKLTNEDLKFSFDEEEIREMSNSKDSSVVSAAAILTDDPRLLEEMTSKNITQFNVMHNIIGNKSTPGKILDILFDQLPAHKVHEEDLDKMYNYSALISSFVRNSIYRKRGVFDNKQVKRLLDFAEELRGHDSYFAKDIMKGLIAKHKLPYKIVKDFMGGSFNEDYYDDWEKYARIEIILSSPNIYPEIIQDIIWNHKLSSDIIQKIIKGRRRLGLTENDLLSVALYGEHITMLRRSMAEHIVADSDDPIKLLGTILLQTPPSFFQDIAYDYQDPAGEAIIRNWHQLDNYDKKMSIARFIKAYFSNAHKKYIADSISDQSSFFANLIYNPAVYR